MARRIRLDAPALAHHVMLHALGDEALFLDTEDRQDFVDRVARILPECGARCFAWALMSNHAHFVLQTSSGALSRVMRRLNTGYAVRFNRRYGRRGYLFMDRFRSRVVESEADLMGLIRYVHLNPHEAGIVSSLDALASYPWSGHAALVGARPAHPFEAVDAALSLFGPDAERARCALAHWMARAEGGDGEVSRDVRLRPRVTGRDAPPDDLPELVRAASEHYALAPGAIASGAKNRRVARARAVVAYVAVVELGAAGSAVARALGVTRAAVSAALDRGRRARAEDRFRIESWKKHPRGET
jgi:REP element-mobilizing transposase RayT